MPNHVNGLPFLCNTTSLLNSALISAVMKGEHVQGGVVEVNNLEIKAECAERVTEDREAVMSDSQEG